MRLIRFESHPYTFDLPFIIKFLVTISLFLTRAFNTLVSGIPNSCCTPYGAPCLMSSIFISLAASYGRLSSS